MAPRPLRTSLRFIATRVLLILLGGLAGLVAMEALLRIFPPHNRFVLAEQLEDLWQDDPQLLLHLKPNMRRLISGHPDFQFRVNTNDEGLRDDPLTGDTFMAAIGDSFTFGFGVENNEAWPQVLESLSAKPVLNLGFAGWSSYVYPAAIRRHAIPHHARLWLWTFFVNDLKESTGAEEFIVSGRTDFKEWNVESGSLGSRAPFPLNLRTAQLLAVLLDPELRRLPDSGSGVVSFGDSHVRYDDYPWRMSDPNDPAVVEGWRLTEAALLEAQQLAVDNGASLIVIFVPSREHVYWPYLREEMAGLDVTQLDQVDSRLARFCRANRIAYLDLLPRFQAAALQGETLYFPDDGHWNARGHELAARAIQEFLEEQRWLP